MKRRLFSVAAVLLAIALVATACGDDGASDANAGADADAGTDAPAPEPTPGGSGDQCAEGLEGGEITVGTFSAAPALDPVVLSGGSAVGSIELINFYGALTRWNPETSAFEPSVAESLTPNDDFTEWTLKLRPEVVFGNGDPLTADIVKFNIERHQDPDNGSRAAQLVAIITAIDVIDDLTLTLTIDGPWPDFPYVLSEKPGMMVNPVVLDAQGFEAFGLNPAGAGVGPFEFRRFSPGEEIVLGAKQDYWGGPVCLEELRFVVLEPTAMVDAFAQGEIDVAYVRDPKLREAIVTDENAGEVLDNLVNAGESLAINSATGPLTDVRLRQAIALAIDTDEVNDRVYDGLAVSSTALFAPSSRFGDGLEGLPFDAEEASRLVAEVKAEGEWDGSITLDCATLQEERAIAYEAYLEAAGFDVALDARFAIGDQVTKVIVNRDYQLACGGFSWQEPVPWAALDRQFQTGAAVNYSGYANDDFDDALAALKVASSPAEQSAAIADLQEIWNETVPGVLHFAPLETIVGSAAIHGLQLTYEATVMFGSAYMEQ